MVQSVDDDEKLTINISYSETQLISSIYKFEISTKQTPALKIKTVDI